MSVSQAVAVTVFSSRSNEWYTPPTIIETARQVLGTIDLDPASCAGAQKTVRAKAYFTREDDGLSRAWHGRVWLNPPYGRIGNQSSQGVWAQYLVDQHDRGNVSAGICLVKAALGYQWFEELWDHLPVCFLRDRVRFLRPDGTCPGSSKQGTALLYVGPHLRRFIHHTTPLGRVILPEDHR